MCTAVYIGSEKELPTIPWNDNKTLFYVELAETEQDLSENISKTFVYYAGSFEENGCGFSIDYDLIDFDNPEEVEKLEKSKKSLRLLIEYLQNSLVLSKEIEMVICREGDQSKPLKITKKIKPQELLNIDWSFNIPKKFVIES